MDPKPTTEEVLLLLSERRAMIVQLDEPSLMPILKGEMRISNIPKNAHLARAFYNPIAICTSIVIVSRDFAKVPVGHDAPAFIAELERIEIDLVTVSRSLPTERGVS
jgi:hypothetical protein